MIEELLCCSYRCDVYFRFSSFQHLPEPLCRDTSRRQIEKDLLSFVCICKLQGWFNLASHVRTFILFFSFSFSFSLATMSIDSQQQAQDHCSILVLTDDDSETKQQDSQLAIPPHREVEDSRMAVDAQGNCQCEVERETTTTYTQCAIDVDIEKGHPDMSKIDKETGGSIKTEIALTKALRRQNSLQPGGDSLPPPIMNHILMFLKLDEKASSYFTAEKPAAEKAHDTTNNRWRKYKRGASFDSRQIVLLFSVLSSMGTLVLIYLTLRVRLAGDGIAYL